MTRLLKTPIIGRNAAPVASSCSDMLAGLSKNEILSVPPAFCAKAASVDHSAINRPPTIATARRFPIIGSSSRCCLWREPAEWTGYHAPSEPGYQKIGRRRADPADAERRCSRLPESREKIRSDAKNHPSDRP